MIGCMESESTWWRWFSRGCRLPPAYKPGSEPPPGTPFVLPDGETWDSLPREVRDALPRFQTLVEAMEITNSDLTYAYRFRRWR